MNEDYGFLSQSYRDSSKKGTFVDTEETVGMWVHRGDNEAICKPRRQASGETKPANTF